MTRKELSAVVAECAARTERAHGLIAESVARAEAARADREASRAQNDKALEAIRIKQEAAVAKHEKVAAEQKALTAELQKQTAKLQEHTAELQGQTAKLEKQRAEADARWQEERVAMRERQEENALKTDAIIAELKEHRDERRALLEAIFRVIDRLDQQQPPPPHLRSI